VLKSNHINAYGIEFKFWILAACRGMHYPKA